MTFASNPTIGAFDNWPVSPPMAVIAVVVAALLAWWLVDRLT